MFLKTIEKSQTDIERNNRIKDSNAKDSSTKDSSTNGSSAKQSGDAQPKISGLQKLQTNASRFEQTGETHHPDNPEQAISENVLSSHETLTAAQRVPNAFSNHLDTQHSNTAELIKQNFRNVYSNDPEHLDSQLDQADQVEQAKRSDIGAVAEDAVPKKTKVETVLNPLRHQTLSDKLPLEHREHQPVASVFSQDDEEKPDENANAIGQVKFAYNNVFVNQELSTGSNSVVQNRFGSDAWGAEFCKKVVWMVSGGEQSAILTLNPPNLGPIKVEVTMQNNIAHTVFESGNAEVRIALENGLSKLRDMLALRGVELGQATVQAENATASTLLQKNRVLNRLLNTFV